MTGKHGEEHDAGAGEAARRRFLDAGDLAGYRAQILNITT